MSRKFALAAVCAAVLSPFARAASDPAAAHAAAESALGAAFHSFIFGSTDVRYKLIERQADQALQSLKDLRNYAGEPQDRGRDLKDEMLDNGYEDWVNTQLLPVLFQAKALEETLKKTYDLEKNRVNADLKTAKGGNYGPIQETIARIQGFTKDSEQQIKSVEDAIAGVRKAYEGHFGLAKSALAEFNKIAVVQELRQSKPTLVRETKLEVVKVRPIEWAIVLVKERSEYNDPRFGQIPASLSLPVPDTQETRTYSVIVR